MDSSRLSTISGRSPERPLDLVRICQPCALKLEKQKRHVESEVTISKLQSQGLLRGDIRPYGDPWPEARESNPYAWQVADDYLPSHGGLWLWGPEGVGKTALARYILTKELRSHTSVAEVSAVELDWRIRSKKKSDSDWWVMVMKVRVLVLDDISAVPMDEAVVRKLYTLADIRATDGHPTIITSNLSPSELHKEILRQAPDLDMLADSTLRRFRPILELKMDGESLRKQLTYKGESHGAS